MRISANFYSEEPLTNDHAQKFDEQNFRQFGGSPCTQ